MKFDNAIWKDHAKASCTPGILAKFEQNSMLGNLLKSTGTKTLVECCKDKDWGTGIPLHDTNTLKSEFWHSQGLLVEILETVRNLLSDSTNSSQSTPTTMETTTTPS